MALNLHSAPGSNAGFSYQFERALYRLAESPAGFVVGIETNDDVAVIGSDGSQVFEQDKHSMLNYATPFGDRSTDLWKTLAIWIEALDSGLVLAEKARFLMITNKVLPVCIAHGISEAKSDEQILECIARLETAAKDPPEGIATFAERVLRLDSRMNLKKLIEHCELADGSLATAGTALRKKTISELQLPSWSLAQADSIVDELLGWVHKTALAEWQQNKPAWINRDHFVDILNAIRDRRKREIVRERAENLIPVPDEDVGTKKGRPFVKQLHLVTNDEDVVETAIREFIRCSIEQIRLSREGNVTDADWKAFETALQSRWNKISARVIRMSRTKTEEDIGFQILSDTTEGYREKLAGIDTDHVYLTSGTYHRMADNVQVGWHPRFKELLQDIKDLS